MRQVRSLIAGVRDDLLDRWKDDALPRDVLLDDHEIVTVERTLLQRSDDLVLTVSRLENQQSDARLALVRFHYGGTPGGQHGRC